MPWWGYLTVAMIFVVVYLFSTYNAVVKLRNQVGESWSGVDVQLKRRRDLVPNLVAAVAAYAKHEAQVLELVTDSRTMAESASHAGPAQAAKAENTLTGSLRGLFVVAENYPQLKADGNFMQLQKELVSIENNVASARAIYNSNARKFNDRIQSIPANFVAGPLGFRACPYVEAAARERGLPRIDFA